MSFRWFLLAVVALAALLYYGYLNRNTIVPTPASPPRNAGKNGEEAVKPGPGAAQKNGFKPRHGTPVVPPGYLPPEANSPQVKKLVDRRLVLQERVPLDIAAKLPSVTEAADVAAVCAVLKDLQDSDTVRNEAANLLRRSKCPELPAVLGAILAHPAETERFRSFAMQHLGSLLEEKGTYDTETLTKRVQEALADRHTAVRREALLALVRIRHSEAGPTAIAWLKAEGPEANAYRDLAIRCVCELDLKEQIPLIRKYARDAEPVIMIAAIVALSTWCDEDSRAEFVAAAKSSNPRVRRAAESALKMLDELKAPPVKD